MVKRQARESIEAQKHQMIAALYANSAFEESDKGIEERKKRIKGLEDHFTKAIELVYHPELHEEVEIDWSNPFWAAAKRAQQRRLEAVRGEGTVAQVIEVEQRAQANPEFDQM